MLAKQNEIPHDVALQYLQEGNARFVAGLTRRSNASPDSRLATENGQGPFAIILTCADSRVAPELIFDQGIGDLFVSRVAGNVASGDVIGSIQYAVQFLRTELVVVLGHKRCGAVGAAIAPPEGAPAELVGLVQKIHHAIGEEKDLQKAVEDNARFQAGELRKALGGSPLAHAKVYAASYDLGSGEVTWL
jgi:carbonic anhydrase